MDGIHDISILVIYLNNVGYKLLLMMVYAQITNALSNLNNGRNETDF
jgi:hypothetical protein